MLYCIVYMSDIIVSAICLVAVMSLLSRADDACLCFHWWTGVVCMWSEPKVAVSLMNMMMMMIHTYIHTYIYTYIHIHILCGS